MLQEVSTRFLEQPVMLKPSSLVFLDKELLSFRVWESGWIVLTDKYSSIAFLVCCFLMHNDGTEGFLYYFFTLGTSDTL